MTSNSCTLPRNAETLRRMLAEKEALLGERERIIAEKETQLAERDRLIAVRDAELYAKTLQIEHLKAQLAVLRRTRFGRSSEKLDREIEQNRDAARRTRGRPGGEQRARRAGRQGARQPEARHA